MTTIDFSHSVRRVLGCAPAAGLTLLAFAFFASGAPVAHGQGAKPEIAAILKELKKGQAPRQAVISPDGTTVAWIAPHAKGGAVIHLASLPGGNAERQLMAGAKCEQEGAAWSPDGTQIAFLAACGDVKQQQVYVAGLKDLKAKKLTDLKGLADSLRWSPDGKRIGFLFVENATRSAGALAAMKPWAGVIGEDGVEIQGVAVVDVASGKVDQVTPPKLHVYEFDWSPDSAKLVYVAANPPGENNWWVAKLYTQALKREPVAVYTPKLQIAVPRWSPDGKQIAFIEGLMSDQGSTGGDVFVIPAAGGEARNLTPEGKTSPAWIAWKNDISLIVTAIAGGDAAISELSLANGARKALGGGTIPASIGDGAEMLSISLSADKAKTAFIRSSLSEAPEVWAGSFGAMEQVTHLNDGLKPAWGKSESISWKNDGLDVQGWLLYPRNYDPARKYPLIVFVHGGPSAAVLPRWPGAGFGAAPFSAAGYFVLEPNPRGSYGQGEAFTAANKRDFGYGDLRDILAGVDTIESRFPIDPQRVGLTGWSYGGFMTMFAVTQSQRFKAAVAGAGIANWQSYYGENSIDQWMTPFFGATVYEDPAVYAKSSAINYIHQVKTPTLVVVGDRDGECPAPQSFEFWHALRAEGTPTQLVVYPNEGHRFANPQHTQDVLERALRWFDQYMPASPGAMAEDHPALTAAGTP